jgi:hypothetical protein
MWQGIERAGRSSDELISRWSGFLYHPCQPNANRQTTMNRTPMPAGNSQPPPFFDSRCMDLLRWHTKPREPGRRISSAPHDQPEELTAGAIVCRHCCHIITFSTEHRIINGAHLHTFANPEGILFEIGCYHDAQGCGYIGPASSEFTWFSGYVWRIAVCGYCHVHLGWRFSGVDGHFFHGLITSRLISKEN